MNIRALRAVATAFAFATCLLLPTAGSAISYPDGTMDARKAGWAVPILITTASGSGETYATCTGSIIDRYTVVTAAHCVEGLDTEQLYAGTLPSTAKGDSFLCGALAADTHPRYTAGNVASADDVAVLSLNPACVDAMSGKPAVKALKLATASTPLTAPLVLYGWGINQNGKPAKLLNYLRVENYSSVAQEVFGGAYKPAMHIAAGHMFTNENVFGGACNGDSGGPLVHWTGNQPFLVGITSFGASGCRVKAPSVFTRVSAVRGWVAKAAASTAVEGRSAVLNFGYSKKICTSSISVTCSKTRGSANIAIDAKQMIVNFDFPYNAPMDIDLDEDGKPDLHADASGIHRLDGSTPPECAIVDASVGWVYNTSCLRLPGVIAAPTVEFNATIHGAVTIDSYLGDGCPDYAETCDRSFAFDVDYVTVPS